MKLPEKLSETPKWKIVGAAAAVAGLGAGGLLGAVLAGGGNDDPVDGINLQDRIALTDALTSTTLQGSGGASVSSLDSPLDVQSVNSVRSVNSPDTPRSVDTPAARPAPAPAPKATVAPRPAPAPKQTAPRVTSFDSPASAPSWNSPASAPSWDSPDSVDSP